MRSPETRRTAFASARICLSVERVEVEAELRDEAQRANEPQRVLREARRRHGPQHAPLEILAPLSGSTISPVERRRAIAFTVKSRRRMSSSTESDASATISKS